MEELKKEIENLKEENKELKQRLDIVEETLAIIKEDLYVELEVDEEFDGCAGCHGHCDSCKSEDEE